MKAAHRVDLDTHTAKNAHLQISHRSKLYQNQISIKTCFIRKEREGEQNTVKAESGRN